MDDRLTIRGRFDADTMVEWIGHRARKLSLRSSIGATTSTRIVVHVAGPPELIDAMALACSLGPGEALIDAVGREVDTEVSLS